MRIHSSLILPATVLAMTFPAVAVAADYDPPIYVEQAPEHVPVEIGSGWYLRGDVGYTLSTSADGPFDYRTFDPIAGTYGADTFDSGEISGGFEGGVGFGYSFSDWLRADATIERISLDFDGTTSSAAPCPGSPVGTLCRSEDSAGGHGYSAMLNGYVDLGTFVGVTPYVGAGAGYTYVRWDDLGSSTYCVGGACPPPALVGTATHSGESSWRFTYALMAGLAYDITENLKVDLGYRYRHIDGGSMFGWDPGSAALGATGTQGSDPGFAQHQVRVGLRYELW